MIGRVVGTYKITEKIGEGGMGEVFRGIDTMLEREVAIKVLRPELTSQPQVVERFRTEAVTLARLNHPNIATLFSFLREGNHYFMVMEYVRGQSLDDVIRKFGAISCARAIPLFCQALDGIDHAHRMGIIHRDIKPANMMLTDSGSIKVMDFGIARVLGTARLTRQGNVVGTIEYMSPEQIRAEESDARSDVYSLGVLLYEMLTGRVPFTSTSEYELMRAQIEQAPPPPRNFAVSIPLPVEQAIMRALAKKIEARFQTAGEFRAALMASQGMVTTPLNRAPGFAAPATKSMDAPNLTHSTGESLGQTRVVGSEARHTGAPTGTPTDPSVASPFKETRIARSGDIQAGSYELVPAASQQVELASPAPPIRNVAAAPRRSTPAWQLYVAAAVAALVVLVSVAIVLTRVRSQNSATTPGETEETQPAAADQTQPPTDSGPAADAAGQTPGNESVSTGAAIDPANADANRDSKSKNAKSDKSELPADATSNSNSEPAQATGADSGVAPNDASSQNANVNAAAADKVRTAAANANSSKNEKKKSGGIGGFFKRVFGGGDEKKKNENKPQPEKNP